LKKGEQELLTLGSPYSMGQGELPQARESSLGWQAQQSCA